MTLSYRSAWLTTLLSFLLALPAVAQAPTDTLATVNGTAITVADFERTYVAFLLATGSNDTPHTRYRHLDDRIATHLLAEEARRQGLDADDVFRVYEERLRRKTLGGRYFELAFLANLAPLTDAEIRAGFVKSRTQVVVRHLVYREAAAAWAAHVRLEAGADFLEEARHAYGLAEIDSTAGFIGPIKYFSMDDAFAEAAFALPVGAYSEPVRSRYGYHVIRAEERISTPLLAESEYQTRRGGVASQLRQRKRQLEGDRFVRSFMEELDVQVDPEGVQALADAIEALEHRAAPEPVKVAEGVEGVLLDGRALRAALTPETVLATFTLSGETRPFTAGQYYFWLPELTFEEARHRTAASLGRALRNEALAVAAKAAGLDDDPVVAEEMEHHARLHLAAKMQAYLRSQPAPPLDEAFLRDAFTRLRLGEKKRWTADFWVLPVAAHADAEAVLARLADDPAYAATVPGFSEHHAADLDAHPRWKTYVRQAPLGTPVLVQTPDGWAVLAVAERTATPVTFAEARDTLAETLAPLAREHDLLRTLRADATITVDTLRFEAIMTLTSD